MLPTLAFTITLLATTSLNLATAAPIPPSSTTLHPRTDIDPDWAYTIVDADREIDFRKMISWLDWDPVMWVGAPYPDFKGLLTEMRKTAPATYVGFDHGGLRDGEDEDGDVAVDGDGPGGVLKREIEIGGTVKDVEKADSKSVDLDDVEGVVVILLRKGKGGSGADGAGSNETTTQAV